MNVEIDVKIVKILIKKVKIKHVIMKKWVRSYDSNTSECTNNCKNLKSATGTVNVILKI